VTEGTFEKDGAIVDLLNLIELKHKYKYRLILDESISFGTVGRTGRSLTELYNVLATQIDMLIGSVANGLNSSGGFCAGPRIVVDHPPINGTSFVFSSAVLALVAVSASEGVNIFRNTPSILSTLHENARGPHGARPYRRGHDPLARGLADHPHLPTYCDAIVVCCDREGAEPRDPGFGDAPSFDIAGSERVLQDIVDGVLALGVWITRARRLRGQELVE